MLKNALASEVRLFDTFFCLEKSEIEQIIRVGGECKTVLFCFFYSNSDTYNIPLDLDVMTFNFIQS